MVQEDDELTDDEEAQQMEYINDLTSTPNDLTSTPNVPESRSSTSGATYSKTFEEETGHPAGEPIPLDAIIASELPRQPVIVDPNNPWAPFPSEKDYALAAWFARSGQTKGEITEYFQDPILNEGLKIRTYNQLLSCLYNIPYSIPEGDRWIIGSVFVESQCEEGDSIEYPLLYRDVQACIEFLLSYAPFASEMA